MASGQGALPVQVCYAGAAQPWVRELSLPPGATLADAIEASGFRQAFPGRDPYQWGVGVFGRRREAAHVLHPHDRVEIYGELVFDPKESRRRRAEHKKKAPKQRPWVKTAPVAKPPR